MSASGRTNCLPGPERVLDGTWVVPVAIPSGRPPYTLCYLLRDGDGGMHVIDPGSDTDANWDVLSNALTTAEADVDSVRSVIVTHLHADHLGLAGRLGDASRAPVILHRYEHEALEMRRTAGWPQLADQSDRSARWGVPSSRRAELDQAAVTVGRAPVVGADVLVDDGDVLDVPGRTLRVIWTPGHTSGHMCLADDDNALLFTGDHVLPTINSGIGLGGPSPRNPVSDYLRSLTKIAELDDYQVCPGHEHRFTGTRRRCAELRSHHLRRTAEIARLVETHEITVWQAASMISWSAGFEQLARDDLRSALAQVAMHMDLIRSGQHARAGAADDSAV